MDKKIQAEELAGELLKLAKDTITVRYRYFDTALSRFQIQFVYDLKESSLRGQTLYINPVLLLKKYVKEPGIAVRLYLHVLLHCIFFHPFLCDKINKKLWNLATDLAVENIILEMDFPAASLSKDVRQRDMLDELKKRNPVVTAENLYRELSEKAVSEETLQTYARYFTLDSHMYWFEEKTDEEVMMEEDFRKFTRRIRTEVKAFSKGDSQTESLENNIEEALRIHYDYREILQRFMVRQEEITVNPDEFDYIYYTYGLSMYGNVPLIEPLEYKENQKIRDFVIAIDTSASCQGETIKKFIGLTYDILKTSESFFHKINVHIIQCDDKVQKDTKITSDSDFQDFIENGKIFGYGDTDFTPVFHYVEKLRNEGEFENLKGLIYFTDGYGFYPAYMPDYDVIFAFLKEDEKRPPVPAWAIKVIMEEALGNEVSTR